MGVVPRVLVDDTLNYGLDTTVPMDGTLNYEGYKPFRWVVP